MRKKGKILIIVGLLFIVAAFGLILYNILDNNRADHEAYEAKTELVEQTPLDPIPVEGRKIAADEGDISEIEYPDYVANPNRSLPVKTAKGLNYVGILRIPALELELPVAENTERKNLRAAPCLYYGSPYLNNMVVCAHNYRRFFGNIKKLNYGDIVTFTDMDGNLFEYEVIEIITVNPDAIEEMTTGNWDMTMFTCTIGGAKRVTVRCALKD